jgi:hypothetical protein
MSGKLTDIEANNIAVFRVIYTPKKGYTLCATWIRTLAL